MEICLKLLKESDNISRVIVTNHDVALIIFVEEKHNPHEEGFIGLTKPCKILLVWETELMAKLELKPAHNKDENEVEIGPEIENDIPDET